MFVFTPKTAYEMRISDWSSDVCSSDLTLRHRSKRLCNVLNAFPSLQGIEDVSPVLHDYLARFHELRVIVGGTRGVLVLLGVRKLEINPLFRSEEQTSELQSLMRISYAVFCLKKKKTTTQMTSHTKQDKQKT